MGLPLLPQHVAHRTLPLAVSSPFMPVAAACMRPALLDCYPPERCPASPCCADEIMAVAVAHQDGTITGPRKRSLEALVKVRAQCGRSICVPACSDLHAGRKSSARRPQTSWERSHAGCSCTLPCVHWSVRHALRLRFTARGCMRSLALQERPDLVQRALHAPPDELVTGWRRCAAAFKCVKIENGGAACCTACCAAALGPACASRSSGACSVWGGASLSAVRWQGRAQPPPCLICTVRLERLGPQPLLQAGRSWRAMMQRAMRRSWTRYTTCSASL